MITKGIHGKVYDHCLEKTDHREIFQDQVHWQKRKSDTKLSTLDTLHFALPFSTIVRRTMKRSNQNMVIFRPLVKTQRTDGRNTPNLAFPPALRELDISESPPNLSHTNLDKLIDLNVEEVSRTNKKMALLNSSRRYFPIMMNQKYQVKRSPSDFEQFPNLPFSTLVRRGKNMDAI